MEGGKEGGRGKGKGGKRTGDDLPGLVSVERGLHAGDGGGSVGVAVERHDLQAEEVLREGGREGRGYVD